MRYITAHRGVEDAVEVAEVLRGPDVAHGGAARVEVTIRRAAHVERRTVRLSLVLVGELIVDREAAVRERGFIQTSVIHELRPLV